VNCKEKGNTQKTTSYTIWTVHLTVRWLRTKTWFYEKKCTGSP